LVENPTAPPGGADDDAPSAELLAALQAASRHVGRAPGPGSDAGPVLRFDAARPAARRVVALGVILAASVIAAGLSLLLPAPGQTEAEVEADLRWAVANVVREVEAFRARTGALPDAGRLRLLLGEHVTYEPVDDAYLVVGERDDVEVTFDGSVPLDEWLAQRGRDGGEF